MVDDKSSNFDIKRVHLQSTGAQLSQKRQKRFGHSRDGVRPSGTDAETSKMPGEKKKEAC